MAIFEKWRKAGDRVDRLAGRLAYRFLGLIAAAIGITALYAGYSILTSGQGVIGGLVFLVCGSGAIWVAKWCFSPDRRLSEMDF